jgi:7,8-dihydropterin-6-yl-methyl-4-(beta-D-ribofuranosyl)aminobenzene 5'-phosphate synthase
MELAEATMDKIANFGQTRDVEITVLVDNRADLLVKSTDTVKRFFKEPLLAEHGFAALVDLKDVGTRILWDAGMTKTVLLENARRMEIDLSKVDKIALSHGHGDHYTAMAGVISQSSRIPGPREWGKDTPVEEIRAYVSGRRTPLIAHPAAFRERWGTGKDGKKHGPSLVPRREWEAAGAEIVLAEGPSRLGPGCWTTGYVPRLSFEKAGIPPRRSYREGDAFIPDQIEDDQSIVINVRGKGLVVLTGCAHAGVLNTIHCAREISGVDRVWAILGGFHLAPADDEDIQRTIDAVQELEPALVAPTHCSGFKAIGQFARQMPDAFVEGAVGTRYLF